MQEENKILITHFGARGASVGDKQVLNLVERLKNKGYAFFLLSDNENLLNEFEKRDWFGRGFWLGEGNQFLFAVLYVLSVISATYALIYFKLKYKTDKIFCLTLPDKLIMTPIAKLLDYKIVWQENESIKPVLVAPVYRFFYNWLAKYATVVASFEFIRAEVKTNCPSGDYRVILPGIDAELYKKQADLFEMMADKSDFTKADRFCVGCISDLAPGCGVEYLIKAMALLGNENSDVELLIASDGASRGDLDWLVEQLNLVGRVKFVGYDGNPLGWMKNFDVFVETGNAPITLIEAMACEKPVISVGGEEIVENGASGLVCPRLMSGVSGAEPQELADAILKIKKDPALAMQMAVGARQAVEKRFGLERMAGEYMSVFEGT
ncbi:MAG: glycosyltransferase family 4 protein [Parcubacteria group bacterium]